MVRVSSIVPPVMVIPKTAAGRINIPIFPIGFFAKGINCIGGDQPHQIAGYITIRSDPETPGLI